MSYHFQHQCDCGSQRYRVLTNDLDDTTVDAIECVECEGIQPIH